jgi:diacylglycerol kinase family enzyme
MRALVVVNHQATTTSPRTRDVLLAALRHDLKVDVAETNHRGHAVELARQARDDGLDLVVAVGGDGTVNEVVNGLLDDGATGAGVPDLALVPGGSTNVLARNLGMPEDPVEATGQLLDAVRSGRRRPLGLGRLDERWFTFCAGVGYDADVIRAVEERRARGRRSTLPLYARTAIRQFFAQPDRRKGGPITLEREGADPVPGIALAVVTNCAPWTYLGGRPLNPTPQADFDAGLDLFALTRLPIVGSLRHLGQITLTGDRGPRGRDVVLLHDQAEFVLDSSRPVPIQVDGDYLGERTRMRVRSYPAALHLVV